jgi:hypothetical protein
MRLCLPTCLRQEVETTFQDKRALYTQLIQFENEDDFICKIAESVEEAKQLVEVDFEYITDMYD